MRFSRLLMLFGCIPLVTPALADECWICDDEVEVNATYAECYIANYDLLMESFDAQAVERQQVNFAGCSSDANATGTRGGLLRIGVVEMGKLPEADASKKTIYTLSRDSAICLKDLIENAQGPLDPRVVFKLDQQCSNE